MDFNTYLENYCKFYNYCEPNNGIINNSQFEPFFESDASVQTALNEDINYQYQNSKFFAGYRSILNTSAMPDSLCSRIDKGDNNFFPEMALMFLKSYGSSLIKETDCALNPKRLISIFNKNQELVEIPYPIALLLGGLYYFQENKLEITDQSGPQVFSRINGVKVLADGFYEKDIYQINDLIRKPGSYLSYKQAIISNKASEQMVEELTFPNVRILNRSVLSKSGPGFNNPIQAVRFNIKNGVNNNGQDEFESWNLSTFTTMPAVGYGIQNKFLNDYNKTLFGEYLNGLKTKTDEDDGKPHVLSGGFSGILKPFKTYNSNFIEFTAFYRNLCVKNVTYDINALVEELKTATKDLKKSNTNSNTLLTGYIKSFIVYSKLKAAFLAGQFGTKALLKEGIKSLCEVNNIDSAYNDSLSSSEKMCDFYYLVSHVFFTSFREQIQKSVVKNKTATPHEASLLNRLNFTNYKVSIGNGKTEDSIAYLQEETVGRSKGSPGYLLNNDPSTKEKQIDNLTNFLYKIWGIEKANLKTDNSYKNISPTSFGIFALYPSAGGFLTPNNLILSTSKQGGQDLNIFDYKTAVYTSTTWDKDAKKYVLNAAPNLYSINDEPTWNPARGVSGLDERYQVSGKVVDPLDGKEETLFSDFKSIADESTYMADPEQKRYIIHAGFDRLDFLKRSNFNNTSILKNTTRFLWFESTLIGTQLSMDSINTQEGVLEKFDFDDGVTLSIYPGENNVSYFRNITPQLISYDGLKVAIESGYINNYDFSRILDSVNVEKLEEFSTLFQDFAKLSPNNNLNTFNLNSLVKSSTILASEHIKDAFSGGKFKDPQTSIELTTDEISYMLIGNSWWNYEFTAEANISKFFNVALTQTQKKRCETVADQFCSYDITIANKSTIDSVTKLGDFQLSLHNFHSSPEVLFTNAKTYDDLKTTLKDSSVSDESFNKLIARRILFGDQYVPSYENVDSLKGEIIELNKSYLYSRIHHLVSVGNIDTTDLAFNNFYFDCVKTFFKYLNIKYTKNNYKQLLKLLRSYIRYIGYQLNYEFLPNNGIISQESFLQNYYNEVTRDNTFKQLQTTRLQEINSTPADKTRVVILPPINPIITKEEDLEYPEPSFTEDNQYKVSDLESDCSKFFEHFNTEIFESTVGGLNSFLNRFSEIMNEKTVPNDTATPYTTQSEEENLKDEIKKRTYYNIKSMYEKTSTSFVEETRSSPIFIPTKIEDIRLLEVSDLKNTKLFYNYAIDPGYCDDNKKEDTNYDLYEIFKVVDRGNNDIGVNVLADLSFFYQNLYADFDNNPNKGQENQYASMENLTNKSFTNLFSGLASNNGFLFQQIPNYINLNGAISATDNDEESIYDIVDQLFGVHTDTDLLGTSSRNSQKFGGLTGYPGYIFQLGTIGSKLDTNGGVVQSMKNDNLNSFCLDVGYDNNREISVKSENAPDDIKKSNVTCFTVDFGTQKQQMFTSVQLDTAEFYDTEESIRTWVDIVNNTQQSLQTTNLFPILEKRAYTCTVTSLGNSTIQPLSYFYLRNVPLFYGTYWITNVAHDIQPNTMVTTFKGARQPISSKTDVRRELLALMRKNAAKIAEESVAANTIVSTEIPNTSGKVYTDDSSSDNPFGDVLQGLSSDATKYYKYDGINVIGTFIFSVTKSNASNDANLGLINVLYNYSKAMLGNTESPAEIVKNMKTVAIGIMNEKANGGDGRYSGSPLSLSKVFKENSSYSLTGELGGLLNKIGVEAKTNSDTTLNDSKLFDGTIFDVSAKDESGAVIADNSNRVTFKMETDQGKKGSQISIRNATFFFDNKDNSIFANTELYGIGVTNENETTHSDVYDVFKSLGGDSGTIQKFDAAPIKKTTTETQTTGTPEPKLKTQEEIQDILSFLDECSPGAAHFFLFYSNGSQSQADYEKYISDYNREPSDDDGDDAWDGAPRNPLTSSRIYAKEAIYYGLVEDPSTITVTDIGSADTILEFNLNDGKGTVSYEDLGSDEGVNKRFYDQYKAYFDGKLKEWKDKNTTKETQTDTGINVQYLGAIRGSTDDYKVAFFTADSGGSFGKIKLSSKAKNAYKLDPAGQDQLSNIYTPQTNSGQSSDAVRFANELVRVADQEREKWVDLTECDTNAQPLLKQYWAAVNWTTFSCSDNPWSAAFISYIIKTAAPNPNDFPYSASHNVYVNTIRKTKTSWKAYSSKDTPIQIGDILCYAQDSNYKEIVVQLNDWDSVGHSHCDCVTNIDQNSKTVNVIGGNLSQKVTNGNYSNGATLTIDNDGKIANPTRTVILRFEPAGDPANANIDLTLSSGFTQYQKYPNLAGVVLKFEGGYNDYNYGSNGSKAFFEGKSPESARLLTKKLTELTVSEVLEAQKTKGLFAVGRYQMIPDTLNGQLNANKYGVTKSDLFTPETQDKLGMGLWDKSVVDYIEGTVSDTQQNIEKAAYEIAGVWAAVGVPYAVGKGQRGGGYPKRDIVKNESMYSGAGVNKSNAPTTTEQVQAALKYERNGGSAISSNPPSSNNTTTAGAASIVIGDSLYASIQHANPKIRQVTDVAPQVGKHLSVDGGNGPNAGGKSLINQLTAAKVYNDVKHVVVTIGANDLWAANTAKQNEAIYLIKQKFPKAKYYIMNGNYGWGGLEVKGVKTDIYWQNLINSYINVFKNADFTVVGSVTKVLSHPGANDAFYNTYKDTLKTLP
jgi:hypothetical protein